jgi:Ni/Co efflux regulator RcnB
MKFKPVICAIAALAMGFSGVTFAQQDKDVRADQVMRDQQQYVDRSQRGRPAPNVLSPPQSGAVPVRQGDGRHNDGRYNDGRRNDGRYEDRGRDWGHDRDVRDRGPVWRGPDHGYYRGDRLPPQYRTRQYVVEDWRGHRLNAPPRGYQWVQSGGDYLLVAVATGIIASILLNQ